MPGCFMILNTVLDELPQLNGMIVYSLFMLPSDRRRRLAVYQRILDCGADLHAAVESLRLAGPADRDRLEDIWLVQEALAAAPKSL
jgi:sporadic carbohydrate cluster protein (TIGR04323 family)